MTSTEREHHKASSLAGLVYAHAALAGDPHKPTTTMRVQVAAELIERGALDEAELIFREILETTPDHAGAWAGLGKVALQQSRPSEALIYFRTALAHDSKSVPALLEAAGVLSADTALPQAEELYRRVLKQEPDHPGALVGLAHIARLRDSKSLEASTNAFEASVTQAQMLLKRQAGVRSFNESAPFRSAIAPAMKEIPAAEARSPLLHTDVEAGVATSIRTANELAFPARPSVEKCGAHLSVQRASARAPRRLLPGFACGLLCVVAVSTPVSFHLTLGDIWQAGSEALSLQRAKAMFEDAKVRFNAAIQYRAPDPSASTSSIARHFPLGGGDHANSARLNPVAAVLGGGAVHSADTPWVNPMDGAEIMGLGTAQVPEASANATSGKSEATERAALLPPEDAVARDGVKVEYSLRAGSTPTVSDTAQTSVLDAKHTESTVALPTAEISPLVLSEERGLRSATFVPPPKLHSQQTHMAPASNPRIVTASSYDYLLDRARVLLEHRDISGARLILEHLVQSGSGQAAFLLGQTYDPRLQKKWRSQAINADHVRASELYALAEKRGEVLPANREVAGR